MLNVVNSCSRKLTTVVTTMHLKTSCHWGPSCPWGTSHLTRVGVSHGSWLGRPDAPGRPRRPGAHGMPLTSKVFPVTSNSGGTKAPSGSSGKGPEKTL